MKIAAVPADGTVKRMIVSPCPTIFIPFSALKNFSISNSSVRPIIFYFQSFCIIMLLILLAIAIMVSMGGFPKEAGKREASAT